MTLKAFSLTHVVYDDENPLEKYTKLNLTELWFLDPTKILQLTSINHHQTPGLDNIGSHLYRRVIRYFACLKTPNTYCGDVFGAARKRGPQFRTENDDKGATSFGLRTSRIRNAVITLSVYGLFGCLLRSLELPQSEIGRLSVEDPWERRLVCVSCIGDVLTCGPEISHSKPGIGWSIRWKHFRDLLDSTHGDLCRSRNFQN